MVESAIRSVVTELIPYVRFAAAAICVLALLAALRGATLWYFKVNRAVALLESIDARLAQIRDAVAYRGPRQEEPIGTAGVVVGKRPTLEDCGYDTTKYDAALIAWHEHNRPDDPPGRPPD